MDLYREVFHGSFNESYKFHFQLRNDNVNLIRKCVQIRCPSWPVVALRTTFVTDILQIYVDFLACVSYF